MIHEIKLKQKYAHIMGPQIVFDSHMLPGLHN